MSKLPHIEDLDALRRIIVTHAREMEWNERLEALIMQNIGKFSAEAQKELRELLRKQSLGANG